MSGSLWNPSVEDVLDIHKDIVSEYPDTSPGVQSQGDVEFALDYIEEGSFGSVPETIRDGRNDGKRRTSYRLPQNEFRGD